MIIDLENYPRRNGLAKFLNRNQITDFKLEQENNNWQLKISDGVYNNAEISAIKRHIAYSDLFFWSKKGIENVLLWEKPERIESVIREFNGFFSTLNYDLITSVEARGFILGGIFCQALRKPFLAIRKYKEIYAQLPGWQYDYVNWKDQAETLFVFKPGPIGKKAMFIDDILDTGNSLRAAQKILQEAGIEIVAAFYLYDCTQKEVRDYFNFPIRSLLRSYDLLKNTEEQNYGKGI